MRFFYEIKGDSFPLSNMKCGKLIHKGMECMSIVAMMILMIIGLIVTVIFFDLGIKNNKRRFAIFSWVPFTLSALPYILLIIIFSFDW